MGINAEKKEDEAKQPILSIAVEVLEWLTKVLATGLATYLAMQMTELTMPDILHEPIGVKFMYIFLVLMFAGVVVSWLSVKWAGFLTLAGYAGFGLANRDFFISPVFPYFLAFGAIMLFCYIYKMKQHSDEEVED